MDAIYIQPTSMLHSIKLKKSKQNKSETKTKSNLTMSSSEVKIIKQD